MNGAANGRLRPGPEHDSVPEGSSVSTRRSLQDTSNESDREHVQHAIEDDSDDAGDPGVDRRVKEIRNLSSLDVAALIINKMIGTGIFTGPTQVLQYTLNKNLAIGLWAFGMVYTLLSMMLYIEYARKLPFTGGELVYIDDAMPKPRLLAYTLYAFYFVFLYTSAANCMSFARFVLAASDLTNFPSEALDHNQRLVRFMAVVAITAVCILLYVSNTKSKMVNKATAGAKILLLLGAIFAGAAYIGKEQAAYSASEPQDQVDHLSGSQEQWQMTAQGTTNWALALITVLFSYHGWENATLVAGEVSNFNVLRRGFLLAVLGVGSLYIAMAVLVCAAFDWQNQGRGADRDQDVPMLPLALYFGGTQDEGQLAGGGAVAACVCIAMSAFGSILSVSYTCVRVKQSIGWANILPWSQVWRRQGRIQPDYEVVKDSDGVPELRYKFSDRPFNRPGTPEGGIILHWATTVIYICATAKYDSLSDAMKFANQVLVFAHFWAEAAVAFLFIQIGSFGFRTGPVKYFPAWNWHAKRQEGDVQHGYPPKWLRPASAPWSGPLLLGSAVFASSFVVIGAACKSAAGRVLLYVLLGIMLAGLVYWYAFVRYTSAHKVYRFFGFELKERVHGKDDRDDPQRVCDWCDVLKSQHRHPTESYEFYNAITLDSRKLGPRLLYTIFDGTDPNTVVRIWHAFWQSVWSCLPSRPRREQPLDSFALGIRS